MCLFDLVSFSQHASKSLAFPVQVSKTSLPLPLGITHHPLCSESLSSQVLPIFKRAFFLTQVSASYTGMGPRLRSWQPHFPQHKPHQIISLFLT